MICHPRAIRAESVKFLGATTLKIDEIGYVNEKAHLQAVEIAGKC